MGVILEPCGCLYNSRSVQKHKNYIQKAYQIFMRQWAMWQRSKANALAAQVY